MCEECECEKAVEEKKADRKFDFFYEYGWNWFRYHAEQRTGMFNYSLAAASLLAAGYGAAIDKHPHVAAAIGLVGGLVTLSFVMIDGRNDKLVRRGERVLKALEQQMFPNVIKQPADDSTHDLPGGILIVNEKGVRTNARDNVVVQYFRGTHRIHLRWIEAIFCLAFFTGAAVAACWPNAFQSKEPSVADSVKLLSDQVTQLNASLKSLSNRITTANTVQSTVLPVPNAAAATPAVQPSESNGRH